MEDITNADYAHRKIVCKDFKIKKLGENHDLYVQSKAIIVRWCIWKLCMCIDTYELNPARFFTTPGLAWKAALKKQSKSRSLNWYRYVINGRKG